MLIINADDWGYDEATTDAIVTAFEAQRLTSASGMVFMRDSVRAAGIAALISIPVGLHLNLMEPYSGGDMSQEVRYRQKWAVARYRRGFRRRWLVSGKLFRLACQAAYDQIDEFERLYGAPTHVDGHQHGHLSPAALWSLARRGSPAVRQSFTFRPAEKEMPNRLIRGALNRSMRLVFDTTDSFHSIRHLHPELGGYGLEDVIAESRYRDIEIMVHPGIEDEFEILMGDAWAERISGAPLGSYRELVCV